MNFQKTSLRVFLTATLLFPFVAPLAAQAEEPVANDPPPEFTAAMDKLANWRDSLDTLKVVYHWDDPQGRRSRKNPSAAEKHDRCRTELKWQDWWINADCQKLKAITEIHDSDVATRRVVTGRVENLQYFAEYSPSSMTPRLMTAADLGSKKTLQLSEQMPLYPIYFAMQGWFSGTFEKIPVEYAGMRTIKGCRCVGVILEGASRPIMWLDLEHDGLPRLIEPAGNVTRWGWECNEFVKTNTGHWFPKSGTFGFTDQTVATFDVEMVEMNLQISSTDFEMPLVSKATYIRDMTADGVKFETAPVSQDIAQFTHASPFSWWRVQCSFGMVVTSAGWFRWRRRVAV